VRAARQVVAESVFSAHGRLRSSALLRRFGSQRNRDPARQPLKHPFELKCALRIGAHQALSRLVTSGHADRMAAPEPECFAGTEFHFRPLGEPALEPLRFGPSAKCGRGCGGQPT